MLAGVCRYSDEEEGASAAEDEDPGGSDFDGAVCISNLDRLGRTEVELVNVVIYGAARMVRLLESRLAYTGYSI
eukprot:COSAG05_NODE_1697_length_4258_cov_7.337822_7_plen_74_part_00